MKSAGKIIIRPMGEYAAATTYSILDLVTIGNKLYISKKNELTGVDPTTDDGTNWKLLIDGSADLAEFEADITERLSTLDDNVAAAQSNADEAKNDASTALTKATTSETKVGELEAKINSLTFNVNIDEGTLEWGMS